MTTDSPLILELGECRDKSVAGGKAANLGALIRAGFPVPGGFVITTHGYRIGHQRDLQRDTNGLSEQIRKAYRAIGAGAVAVRSSATAEDMAEASMAGQYDTFLDVSNEEGLLRAVQCCWASLQSPRTRSYLAEHGIDVTQLAMAVVVQRLVPADVAGVLFSANPHTGSRQEMLIEASWGLGEAVVAGLVQPDVLLLDGENGRVVKATISDKQVWVPPGRGKEEPLEEDRRRIACLRSADVGKLWDLGRRVGRHFDRPQDIEWAIHGGELYLLQSRPITTLEDAEEYEQLLQSTRATLRTRLTEGRGPWVLHNISETLPHPTPLTWSVVKRFMSGAGGFGQVYRLAGFDPSERVCRDGFLENIAGRVYMDLSLAPEMFFADFPFKYDLDELRRNPEAGQAPPTVPCGSFLTRAKAGRAALAANRKLEDLAKDFDKKLSEKIIPDFVAWCSQEKKRNLSKLSADEWIDLWRQREQKIMDEFAPQSLLPSLIAGMAMADLQTTLQEYFWNEAPDVLVRSLCCLEEPDQTLLAGSGMYQVAIGKLPSEKWLAEHGHRAPAEFDLATPRWNERPAEFVDMASRLKGGKNPATLHEEQVKRTAEKLNSLLQSLSTIDGDELKQKLALVRRYLKYREDGKHFLMLGYQLLRDLASEAGRRLDIGADVFQLTLEELFDAVKVGFAPHHLIGQRHRQFRAEQRVSLPPAIGPDEAQTLGQAIITESAGTHSAFAVSSGTATGPAQIVHQPQDAPQLKGGYILICPSTDPGWTPLLVNAAGLIVECGGTLSHGAVVARELNIPAVVLPNATRLFKDGESIILDGRNGIVSRVDENKESSAQPIDYRSPLGTSTDKIANDTHVRPEHVPPVAGRRERSSAKLRNIGLVIWGIYLLGAYLLPEPYIYQPSLRVIDAILWPLVRSVGKPATVAILAAALGALTMFGQRFLTDNARLLEAKRRADALQSEIKQLPKNSPRAKTLAALTMPVRMRIFMAALVPLAVLLGPMVMTFAWLPARIDPLVTSAPAGSSFTVVAQVKSNCHEPVVIDAPEPLSVANKQSQNVEPIRKTLEDLRAKWSQQVAEFSGSWDDLPAAAAHTRQKELLEDLQAYLRKGIPAQSLSWTVKSNDSADGQFPITVSTGQSTLKIHGVLGQSHAPAPTEVQSNDDASPLESLKIVYERNAAKPMFWAPFARFDRPNWDLGWLMTYLLAYLPVMFGLRWALRIA